MTMLDASEFSAGALGYARGLCFIAPRNGNEAPILVAPGNPQSAIFLAGHEPYMGFPYENNEYWKGIIIPNIRIELDFSSLVNLDYEFAPRGAMVRHGKCLSIAAIMENSWRDDGLISLIHELSPCQEKISVGFRKWQIVLGEGQAKRILWTVDLTQPKP